MRQPGNAAMPALEIYERMHDLQAKQVDVANIARQVGVSRTNGLPLSAADGPT
jgi:hypothetical protein